MSEVLVRPARPEDGPAYVGLVRALAEFEKLPGPTDEAARRLLEDAFGPRPRYTLTVADVSAETLAYAVTFDTYSTFRALPTLFLEDLFVHPRARRRGVATSMLAYLRAHAERNGYGRFEWNVLDWNVEAQAFYRRLGAEVLHQWWVCRISLP
ncbi:MAG TPA: GNAT family N-acetyltransferase [Haliangiales bacterium]|nr:GNAT family N-acetyltransferase [Haliangiales bacterium]